MRNPSEIKHINLTQLSSMQKKKKMAIYLESFATMHIFPLVKADTLGVMEHTHPHTVTHTLQRKVLLLTKRVTEFTAM